MKAPLLALAALLTASSPAFATDVTLTSFLRATEGTWKGKGTLVLQVKGPAKTYPIAVTQTSTPGDAGTWNVTNLTTGTPGNAPATKSSYKITGDDLSLVTTSYTEKVQLQASTAQQLAYTSVHTDATTKHSVKLVRSMTLGADSTLHVLSDVFQDSTLVEHFDFQLQKTAN